MSWRAQAVCLLLFCGLSVSARASENSATMEEFRAAPPPLELTSPPSEPGKKVEGFNALRKQVLRDASRYLRGEERQGVSPLRNHVLPVLFETATEAFVPRTSGDIEFRDPVWLLDRGANHFIGGWKNRLRGWLKKTCPSLPIVGNPLVAFLDSQRLFLRGGKPQYRDTGMKNQFGSTAQVGGLSLSGEVDSHLNESSLQTAFNARARMSSEMERRDLDVQLGQDRGKLYFRDGGWTTKLSWRSNEIKLGISLSF